MGSITENSELPPLPANEKTYAGIPEAVFVVSISYQFVQSVSKPINNLKKILFIKRNKDVSS